jgi:ankyrin repeat protein
MLELFVAALFMIQAAPQAIAQTLSAPISIPREEADRHQLRPDKLYLPVQWDSRDPLDGWITMEVVTDTAGAVVSAKVVPESGPEFTPENIAQAESLVRALRFTPFKRNGQAVMARFERHVNLLPPEVKLVRRVPFPKVKDWKTVKITLLRATPYGTDYTLAVYADGTVMYRGYSSVAFTGRHRGSVPRQNVPQLVKLFEQADFYSLRNEYSVHADAFIRTISIAIDGRRKRVEDEDGLAVGMPLAVERLEDAIDRLSGSERWTQGNAETLTALEAEHWDFKSQEAADTLARVAAFGNAQAVRDLVRAGVPLSGKRCGDLQPDQTSCYAPLEAASGHGDLAMLQVLLSAGASANTQDLGRALVVAGERGDLAMLQALLDAGAAKTEDLGRALVAAAGSRKVAAFELLLAYGASMDARDQQGHTVLMAAARSGSPTVVREILKSHPDVNATSSILCMASAGVPAEPRPRDCKQSPASDGHTALMEGAWGHDGNIPPEGVDRAEVVRLLLAAGADVNARDKLGLTPLALSTFNPQVVRLLLEAGADPNVRDYRGETAWGHTSNNDEVKRRLIEHVAVPVTKKPGRTEAGKNCPQFSLASAGQLVVARPFQRVSMVGFVPICAHPRKSAAKKFSSRCQQFRRFWQFSA